MTESRQLFPHGSITELFSFFVSAVILMDYDEGQKIKLLSLGYFSVNLIMQATCPIFSTVCCVEGFQWPLTKDTVIIRMAKRTFAIALPGLLYGLQFPKLCPEVLINTLERVFLRFGHYKDIKEIGLGYLVEDNEPNMWKKLRPQIEPMAHETLARLGQSPGLSRFRIPNYNSCFLRATRMSATTKLITDSMVRSGTLIGTQISIRGTNPPEVHHKDLAFASVSVFSCVVDAVELAWVVSCGIKDVDPPLSACPKNIGFKVWNLNEEGLVDFMHRLGPFAKREEEFFNDKERRWKEEDKEIEEAETSEKANNNKGKEIEAYIED